MACTLLCSGFGHLWMADIPKDGGGVVKETTSVCTFTELPADLDKWVDLPAIKSVELEADVTDPTEVRHSGTNGLKVEPCPGSIKWEVNAEAYLCPDDWIYNYILERAVCPSPSTLVLNSQNTAVGVRKWFYASPTPAPPSVFGSVNNKAFDDPGYYFIGIVQPGGYEFDNDSEDPISTEFSMKVQEGPWMPGSDIPIAEVLPTGDKITPRPIGDGNYSVA